MAQAEKRSSSLMLAFAWTIVAIPLGWGVYQSVVKSIPLFRTPAVSKPAPGGH